MRSEGIDPQRRCPGIEPQDEIERGQLHAIPAAFFGVIECLVRLREQDRYVERLLVAQGYTDADGCIDRTGVNLDGLRGEVSIAEPIPTKPPPLRKYRSNASCCAVVSASPAVLRNTTVRKRLS